MARMQTWLQSSAFPLWLVFAVLLAVFFPEWVLSGGLMLAELSTKLGVWVIFFLLGLSLPLEQLSAGYKPLRLQIFVLSWNFIGFPLLVFWGVLFLGCWMPVDLKMGFGLLAIMPTTIASAVTFTQLSGGRVENAIVATVASNVLAVLVVPLLCVAYFQLGAAVAIPWLPLIIKIGSLILLPLILGQVVRARFPEKSLRISLRSKPISQGIILFIVHVAFAKSVSAGDFGQLSVMTLVGQLGGVLMLLATVSCLTWWTSAWLRFERGSRIAVFYCASQKSIATGLPLSTAVLAALPQPMDSALILMPLILYHPLQLLLAGVVCGRIGSVKLA